MVTGPDYLCPDCPQGKRDERERRRGGGDEVSNKANRKYDVKAWKDTTFHALTQTGLPPIPT